MKVACKNIQVKTDGKIVADKISFTIGKGEIHVLMGPNGSGKSSLLNGMFGHPKYEIAKGSIVLDGEDVTHLTTDKKAKRGLFLSMQHLPEVGGVALGTFLYQAHKSLTGSDISILDFYKQTEEKALALDISKEFLRRGLNTGLSGGEKKQSEILQLMALEPAFAFLDEIDSGVDVDSLQKVFKGINMMRQAGTGFFLVTHYTKILDHITPDYVHIMKDGRLVRSGGRELVREIEKKGFGK